MGGSVTEPIVGMYCRNVALLPSFNRIMEDRFSESFPVGSPGKLDASASCEPVEDTPLRQALRATEESLRYLRQAQLELALPLSHLPSQKAVSFDTHSWRSNKQCQVSSELRSLTLRFLSRLSTRHRLSSARVATSPFQPSVSITMAGRSPLGRATCSPSPVAYLALALPYHIP